MAEPQRTRDADLVARKGLATIGVVVVAASVAVGAFGPLALAIALAFIGAALIVLGFVVHKEPRVEVTSTGLKVDLSAKAERAAAAKAADVELPPAEVAREIDSDDQSPPTRSPEDPDVIGTLNFIAGSMALQAIFDWTTATGQPLHGCEMRLYLLDEDEQVLKAVLAPNEVERATAWEIGAGATGEAYETGKYVLATGDAVWDTTHKVKPEQRQRFQKMAAVAASPVFNDGGDIIGVLTVSTPALDHNLETADARRDHHLATLLVSRVLVELLQWFPDHVTDPESDQGAVTPDSYPG